MARAQDIQIIAIRNFVVITLVWLLILFSCFYFTGLFLMFLIYGTNSVRQLVFVSFTDQIFTLLELMFTLWTGFFRNRQNITFTNYNYFLPKLLIGSFLPITLYGIAIIIFREALMDWRPFEEEESVHGTAHWATPKEIQKAGLRKKRGLMLGKYKGHYLIADDDLHILLFAPTGSGKGVGFVIPNLLFWHGSVIVHDVKLEVYTLTSGYRFHKMKQKVFVWNPAEQEGYTHCYNPMDWIARDIGKIVDDVQKMTNHLAPNVGGNQDFWITEGRALMEGIILYLLTDKNKIASLGELLRMLRSDDVAYNLAVVLDTMGEQLHPVAYMNLAAFLQKADKERSGVISTASSKLDLWANPIVDAATAKSHFNIGTFKRDLQTLYVGVAPNNIKRLEPLLRIFYEQISSLFTKKLPDLGVEKYPILMMLDEFPTLGRLKQIESGIAFFRGYRVKLFLIIQDTEQLKKIYKETGLNSFLSNSAYRITFAANNPATADLISKLLGNKTIISQSYSRPKYLDLNPGARNINISKSSRALLLPQEIIHLPRDEEILLIESHPPIRCQKIYYYKDKFFTDKLIGKTPIPKQEPYIAKKQRPVKKEEE
jgi:type IV secretion system protein VirD4